MQYENENELAALDIALEKFLEEHADGSVVSGRDEHGISDEELELMLVQLPKEDRYNIQVQLQTIEAYHEVLADLCQGGCGINVWTPEHEENNNNLCDAEEPQKPKYWLDDVNVNISTPFVVARFLYHIQGGLDRELIWCNPGTKYSDIASPPRNTILGRHGGFGEQFHSMVIGNAGTNLIDITQASNLGGVWHFNRNDFHMDAYILAGNSDVDSLANVQALSVAVESLTTRALQVYSNIVNRALIQRGSKPIATLTPQNRMTPSLPRPTRRHHVQRRPIRPVQRRHQPQQKIKRKFKHKNTSTRRRAQQTTRPRGRRHRTKQTPPSPVIRILKRKKTIPDHERNVVGQVTDLTYPPL